MTTHERIEELQDNITTRCESILQLRQALEAAMHSQIEDLMTLVSMYRSCYHKSDETKKTKN